MNRSILYSFTLAAYSIISGPLCADDSSHGKIKRFVQKVALGVERGSSDNVASRWVIPPTVSVYNSTLAQKTIVNEVFSTVNSCLKTSIGEIVVLSDNNSEADLKIIFTPQRDFGKIAREYDFRCKSGSLGFHWMFWDDENRIKSSIVLLAADKLSGDILKRFTFEQIIRALGLSNHSDEFSESIFYKKGKYNGITIIPSELDLQLLRFFYQYVEPGDRQKDLNNKFETFWFASKTHNE
jgi:hypothetical protein